MGSADITPSNRSHQVTWRAIWAYADWEARGRSRAYAAMAVGPRSPLHSVAWSRAAIGAHRPGSRGAGQSSRPRGSLVRPASKGIRRVVARPGADDAGSGEDARSRGNAGPGDGAWSGENTRPRDNAQPRISARPGKSGWLAGRAGPAHGSRPRDTTRPGNDAGTAGGAGPGKTGKNGAEGSRYGGRARRTARVAGRPIRIGAGARARGAGDPGGARRAGRGQ